MSRSDSTITIAPPMLLSEPATPEQVPERRRSHRSPVSWPVRLWLGDNLFTPARALNISRGGICIRLSPSVSITLLRVGHGYRIEISPGFADDFLCLAEVRYLSEHGVGMSIKETLAFPCRGLHRPLR